METFKRSNAGSSVKKKLFLELRLAIHERHVNQNMLPSTRVVRNLVVAVF